MAKAGKTSGTAQAIHNVVIGTAGHIDHGKTSLVRRLTGIDADRLPEEKERGMTIDLGFARYELRDGRKVGIIDVPGHERFIKNMVAGASGIDLVVLVVAADDGVMPQTREHLEIMGLLGLRHGFVVVTKKDLVDPDLFELAVEDVREAVMGSFLEGKPILGVSSTTGEGFDRLVDLLHESISEVRPRDTEGIFRMPVQRIFSSKGFGTILTGVPVTGRAVVGDTVELLPLGQTGRIRGVQAYFGSAEAAQAGQSSAINVSDIDYKVARRGMVLASPGHFRSASMLEARFEYLASQTRPLRHLSKIRFHCGTAEVLGTLYVLDGRQIEPGSQSFVQIRLDEPVVVAPGDRFVLRLHSPMITIGGGEVLDISRWRLKQGKRFVIDGLRRKEESLGSPLRRLFSIIDERGFEAAPEKDVARGTGIPPETVSGLVEELLQTGEVVRACRPGFLISGHQLEEAGRRAESFAESFFRDNPRRLLMEKLALRQTLRCDDVFFQDLLARLERERIATPVKGEFLRWSGHHPRLDADEAAFRDRLLQAIRAGGFSPPRVEEVASAENFPREIAESLAELLVEEDQLVRISDEVLYHMEVLKEARELLRDHLEKNEQMTASEAKNVLGSSRKYIIPLLELFDRDGLTVRRGDVRVLRKS